MWRPALFTLSDGADERRIAAVAGHEVRVGVGARVEQRMCDRDGIVVRRRQREPREAEIQERLPSFGAEVAVEILRAADAGAVLAGRRALPRRQTWIVG